MARPSWVSTATAQDVAPPAPCGPIPSERQLRWHELEYYGFLHFTMNTFTDKEWGYGDESPALFNPTDFDANEIARIAKEVGMKGLILTTKHHDGFCLWPSQYTEHSVKNSSWKNGKGDVVKEIADACRRHELKFGVYLSPWDRNHKDYGKPRPSFVPLDEDRGKPEYVTYYRNQLRELLTNYGEIFEVWHDGANGGDGYYGGARETRTIDRKTYYDWPTTWALVRQLQPNALIFSDVGPDIRWVGNENGYAGETCWAMYTPVGVNGDEPAPGYTRDKEGIEGHRDGKFWLPAECDVSIRPGWFYHAHQDSLVKSSERLFELYFQSVGRNGSLLLNVPPDRRGCFHESDVKALLGFKRLLDQTFLRDFAAGATVHASNVRGKDRRFAANNVVDNKKDTYWATDDSVTTASLVLA
jgi:alpha-L-fucosidase